MTKEQEAAKDRLVTAQLTTWLLWLDNERERKKRRAKLAPNTSSLVCENPALDALEQLCCYVTNNPERYRSRNPYCVPAIENALKTIAEFKGTTSAGGPAYLDALNGVHDRFQES